MARPCPAPGRKEEPVIIFDWDDTLCPTWFIKHVILQSCAATSSDESGAEAQRKQDEQFAKPLAEHTRVVMDVLRQARKVAKVGIVTLAQKPWVELSMSDYMKNCGLEELLRELQIEFFYAELPDKVKPNELPGVVAKKVAITDCINKLHNGGQLNVVSIGDSACEAEATREVMRGAPRNRLCKTVKLPENPWLTELTEDLKKLHDSLAEMANHDKDFDCMGCIFPEPKTPVKLPGGPLSAVGPGRPAAAAATATGTGTGSTGSAGGGGSGSGSALKMGSGPGRPAAAAVAPPPAATSAATSAAFPSTTSSNGSGSGSAARPAATSNGNVARPVGRMTLAARMTGRRTT